MEELKLHETLKELRKQNNYSQENLADILHVSRQSLSKWERGEATPDVYSLNKMAELYKVSLDDLLKGNIQQNAEPIVVTKKEKPLFNVFMSSIVAVMMFAITLVYPILFNTIEYIGLYPSYLLAFGDDNFITLSPIFILAFIFLLRTLIAFREKNNYQTLINLFGFAILIISSFYLNDLHATSGRSGILYDTYYLITSLYAACFMITLLAFKNKFSIRSNNLALNIGFLLFAVLSILTIFDKIIPANAGIVFIVMAIIGFFLLLVALIEKTGLSVLNIISVVLLVFGFTFGILILANVLIKEWLFITTAAVVTIIPMITLIINLASKNNLEPLSEKLKQWNY